MNVQLICTKENEEKVMEQLNDRVNFTNDGEFILIERHLYENKEKPLLGYIDHAYAIINKQDILFFESLDDTIFCYTSNEIYRIKEKLYELEFLFSDKGFLRVSKSYIINIQKIKKIKPIINRKFILTMNNGYEIDVTRSYYLIFKEFLGL